MNNLMTHTIIFFGTKGGVGTTTIALNTALSLSLKKKKVLFLGMDLAAPLDIARMCSIKKKHTMVDLIPVWDEVKNDSGVLKKDFFTPINSYLDFIGAVISLKMVSHFNRENTGLILKSFNSMGYDFIIIDGGKNLTEIVLSIFDNANLIFLVATPDILSLYQTKAELDTFQSLGFPLKMMQAILNRSESKGSVSSAEIKILLPIEIFCQLPSEGKTAGLALNRSNPIVDRKSVV